MAGFYADGLEQALNEMMRPERIVKTAERFRELEKKLGPYEFGAFAQSLVPNQADWSGKSGHQGFDSWKGNAQSIPEDQRKTLTEVIGTNLRSHHPLPMRMKVVENVDATHDVVVRTFAHDGHIFIGVLILCPNPDLRKY